MNVRSPLLAGSLALAALTAAWADDTVTGRINGQTCQEKDGVCLLFKEPFSVRLNRIIT